MTVAPRGAARAAFLGVSVKRTVSALYVESGGVYASLPGVDPWDVARDARRYRGPHPVVAHPPCRRWGRYWHGGPSARERRIKGDDDGCFAAALFAARTWGGVIEHPEASHAWRWFGLPHPARGGGWTAPDEYGGRSCCVEQGHYGHRARKATWLYAVGCDPVELIWGPSEGVRLDAGYHSAKERQADKNRARRDADRLTQVERISTPAAFRDLLLAMARSSAL